jgi:hypothetical protein
MPIAFHYRHEAHDDNEEACMRMPRSVTSAALALGLFLGLQSSLHAQVVEERESQANPSVVIFRATLYGAGTGLLLGGAWALVEETDQSTSDILKWGAAGGAATGALVGLIYVATRAGPEGDAEVVGMLESNESGVHLGLPSVRRGRIVDAGGKSHRVLEARLVQARF